MLTFFGVSLRCARNSPSRPTAACMASINSALDLSRFGLLLLCALAGRANRLVQLAPGRVDDHLSARKTLRAVLDKSIQMMP